jgi:hypothetical protein
MKYFVKKVVKSQRDLQALLNLMQSDASDKPEYGCAKLLIDSLQLCDDSVMTDQQIIDIIYHVKRIASDVEHFPRNPFIDVENNMEVEEFMNEWKRLFEFSQFDQRARGHLVTSLAGKIGCACRKTIRNICKSENFSMIQS